MEQELNLELEMSPDAKANADSGTFAVLLIWGKDGKQKKQRRTIAKKYSSLLEKTMEYFSKKQKKNYAT